jgi:hypothetical protein
MHNIKKNKSFCINQVFLDNNQCDLDLWVLLLLTVEDDDDDEFERRL